MIDSPIRFGIMCHNFNFPEWQVRTIELLLEHENIKFTLLIINDNQIDIEELKTETSQRRHILWRMLIDFKKDSSNVTCTKNLHQLLNKSPSIKCKTIAGLDGRQELAKNDIDLISNYKLDFIINFGFDHLKGRVLGAAKFGIWSTTVPITILKSNWSAL